jgi:DNA-directed RNA polymerase subunit RPC12/RpoP
VFLTTTYRCLETFVELGCAACEKHRERSPTELPAPNDSFDCPDCGERRPLSGFARTDRDVQIVRESL